MNTRRTLAAAGALLLAGACTTTPMRTSLEASSPLDLPRPEPREANLPGSAASRLAAASPRQDYSPESLFGEQHGDFLAKMDRYRPRLRGSFLAEPSSSLDGEPGEFDMTRYAVNGQVPVVLDPDSVVLVGGHAEARRYEVDSTMRGVADETLGSVGVDLGYGRFFSEDTYGYAVFSPGVYSDFDGGLHTQDWEFFGEAMAVFRYREDLYFRGGLRVSEDFDDVPIYPMLGLSWLINDQWRIDITAPRQAEISFQPNTPTTLYAGIEIEGQEYRVRSSAATGKRQSNLQVQELRIYVGGVHRFDDSFSGFARLGAVVAGDHKFTNTSGQPVQGQLDPTLLFEVGLGWDF